MWSSVICHLVWCISTKLCTISSQYMNIHVMFSFCPVLARMELCQSVLVTLSIVNIHEYLLVLNKTDSLKVCHPYCVNIICNSKETVSMQLFIIANIHSYMLRLYKAAIIRLYISEIWKKKKLPSCSCIFG